MGIFDSMLAEIGSDLDADAIGHRVGLPAAKVEQIIAALGIAFSQPGDTVEAAAASSGISPSAIRSVLEDLGGEQAMSKFAGLLGKRDRRNPVTDRLDDFFG